MVDGGPFADLHLLLQVSYIDFTSKLLKFSRTRFQHSSEPKGERVNPEGSSKIVAFTSTFGLIRLLWHLLGSLTYRRFFRPSPLYLVPKLLEV
mmetsp:Transcript_15358/g.33717  ORF Transcript_15358/g.33717 Transcript_15358/m.33717 type:complete len:93 (+) Transcript_15358:1-279(+)